MNGIYKITNKVNGKIYIGSSSNIGQRWEQHLEMLSRKCHHSYRLQNDYNEYGACNFIFEILEILSNKDTSYRLSKEQEYLDNIKSYNEEIGYNISETAYKRQVNMYELLTDEDLLTAQITSTQAELLKKNIVMPNESHKIHSGYEDKNILSTSWLKSASDSDFKKIKRNTSNYFKNIVNVNTKTNRGYWTCNSLYMERLKGDGYTKSWIPSNSVGLVDKRNNLSYLMNVFANDFTIRELKKSNKEINKNEFALYSILTWIINVSDINKPINIYIPSKRMRRILNEWIKS